MENHSDSGCVKMVIRYDNIIANNKDMDTITDLAASKLSSSLTFTAVPQSINYPVRTEIHHNDRRLS